MRGCPPIATRVHILATLAMLTALAACGAPAPSGVPVAPTAAPSPVVVAPTPAGTPQVSSPESPQVSTPPGVVRDDSLLAILPPDLDGFPVTAEEESFAEAAADPAFTANVTRAAFGIVVGPDDLASGVVAEVVPGAWSDAFFRDWRETYSQGACAQAGGVVASAEAELDGRTVYITTCDGGLRVYHAYVEERGVLVSLFSLGDARFGERLMSELRP